MKKSSRREQLSEFPSRGKRGTCQNEAQKGRWEFITSGSIFALGNETARRAAYRTATGELRFLPL